jgi:hypothetical protein
MNDRDVLRIYVDFNTALQDDEARVWLPTNVRPDLLEILTTGQRVILYDEEIQVDAVVEQVAPGDWWARPEPGTYRELAPDESVPSRALA